jgi:dolichyl-phosphate-mannose--protein O-mannosyl transferase
MWLRAMRICLMRGLSSYEGTVSHFPWALYTFIVSCKHVVHPGEQDDDVTLVRDGDIIQLFHVITRGVLHTHDVSSVVTPSKQEMSVCHAHDRWKEGTRFQVFFYGFREYWKPFETLVKLVNVGDIPTTVQLTGHVLPDFALRQYEVVSARDTEGLMELWQAEHHEHHKLRAVKRASLPKLSTFSKIIENLQAMFMANTKLVGEHHYSTRPQRWPFLPKGISFFQDPRPDHRKQIYMLGNVACWWLTHGLLVAFLALWTW